MFRSPKDVSFERKDIVIKNNTTDGYHCDLCGEGPWSTELDVDIHRKNEHIFDLLRALKNEDIPMCSICLRVQPSKQQLIEHILVNHFHCPPNAVMINREIFICDHCQRLFFNKQLLIIHIYHWHTIKTPENTEIKYNCPKCCRMIKAKSAWFHLLYHGCFNVGTCPFCLKIFENRQEMLEHAKSHPSTFRCSICDFQTTKECYLNSHLAKHKKIIDFQPNDDAARFFLPDHMVPSLNNRMIHIFKGIPLAAEVKICILCRALAFSDEEMRQHIFAAHVPEKKLESKTHQCLCGEVFFNNVLLKHHIFKLKGNHGVFSAEDGVSPAPDMESSRNQGSENIVNVYQIYGISDPLTIGMNEIIITGLQNHVPTVESEEQDLMTYEEAMET
ncbi:hypothetical protein PYW07_012810 [Mythimna separata]|uniref:C2H2-type domain-containing protein n=1 Tax=Mythimna separata TaxID=271217 RepID=A0AAD8DLN2_MYTSE|nr:hypothetical protein PYW07_012810 [Mythimna separata]